VASYAHALARAGRLDEARIVIERRGRAPELDAVLRWLDQGAPSRPRTAKPQPRRLARALTRGMKNLPFDANQRERALALARDYGSPEDVAAAAAAIAYAIVYIDHVPLSQAEVAAPFRVGVNELRGVFAEIRAKLDIIRGDARYATNRRG